MVRCRGVKSPTHRGFTLVLVLFLIVLLAASGSGLAFVSATEGMRSRWLSQELDHRLIAESVIAVLPNIVTGLDATPSSGDSGTNRRRFELAYGDCRAVVAVVTERDKRLIDRHANPADIQRLLRSIARSHDLPPQTIREVTLAGNPASNDDVGLVWFDQIIRRQNVEDVFPWLDLVPNPRRSSQKSTWSDLITFWPSATHSLVMHTVIEHDIRRWYAVVKISDGGIETLHLGRT